MRIYCSLYWSGIGKMEEKQMITTCQRSEIPDCAECEHRAVCNPSVSEMEHPDKADGGNDEHK